MKPCPPGKERNPITKRCRKVPQGKDPQGQDKPCPPGKERNPVTKRCRKVKEKEKVKVTPDILWASNSAVLWKRVLNSMKDVQHIPRFDEGYTKKNHIELLKWKMSRGKWRAMLMKYAQDLQEQDLNKVLERLASIDGDDWKKQIKAFTTLKGTGVALASAFLSSGNPEEFVFMSDILIALVCKIEKPKYNISEYEEILKAVREKSKRVKLKCAEIEEALFIALVTSKL